MSGYLLKIKGLLLLLCAFTQQVQAQPMSVPQDSYPDYFTYYNPANADMPAGADVASKGIILLSNNVSLNSTAFLIWTLRNDNKVCMCLTGHQIDELHNNTVPGTGSSIFFNTEIYMDYLGKDSLIQTYGNSMHLNTATGMSKGYLDIAELVAYFNDTASGRDIALVLVDKDKLPKASFSALGYDFNNGNLNWIGAQYYSIGHPYNYQQRIQKSLTITANDPYFVKAITYLPFAGGAGSSGSPLINHPSAPYASWSARGVLSYGVSPFSYFSDPLFGNLFSFFNARFTKIGVIENEIRRYCWRQNDSALISSSGNYKQPMLVSNVGSLSAYSQNQTVTIASSIVSSSAAFTQTLPGTASIKATYLKANVCNISGFTLPTTYPGGTNHWMVTIAAKQINLSPEFSYTALGSAELHLASVVVSSSTARMAMSSGIGQQQVAHTTSAGITVYPNPSANGVFKISFPSAEEQYRLVVYSTDGRQVYAAESITGGNPYRLNISGLPRGAYVLAIYRRGAGEKLFGKTIVF